MGFLSGLKSKGGLGYQLPGGYAQPVPDLSPLLGAPVPAAWHGGPMMHGESDPRDLDKPERRRRRGIGGFLHRLGDRMDGERDGRVSAGPLIANVLQALQMSQITDPYQRMRLQLAMQERADERRQTRAAATQRQEALNIMQKPEELGGRGASYGDAYLAGLDLESFAQNNNEQYGTFNLNQGEGLYRGGFNGPQQIARMPTTTEQHATALGLQPGTDAFNAYVRNDTLGAYGPEGVRLSEARIDVQRDAERGRATRHTTPRATNPRQGGGSGGNSQEALYTSLLRRHQQGGTLNPREWDFVRMFEATRNRRIQNGGRRQDRPGGGQSRGGSGARARLNGRTIVPSGNGWVYEDTGEPAQ